MTAEPDAALEELCAALEATAQRPLTRTANRWLGEAHAVAEDVRGGDLDPATRRDRLETVSELLAEVDETGDQAGDDHLREAEAALATLLAD